MLIIGIFNPKLSTYYLKVSNIYYLFIYYFRGMCMFQKERVTIDVNNRLSVCTPWVFSDLGLHYTMSNDFILSN